MTYSTAFVSLFKIPGCFVRNIEVSETEIIIHITKRRKTATCPGCGKRTRFIHQYHKRKLLHTVIGTQKVYLLLSRRRFKCFPCRRVFAEDIPFLLGKKRRTQEIAKTLLSRLKKESFRSTTQSVGISYGGLRDCLMAVVDPFLPNWSKSERQPFALGIDEHYARKNRYALSVTNLTAHKPITFLPSDKVSLLRQFLAQMPKEIKDNITETCCDMHEGFIYALEKELPNVPIVIDHFHLIQDANRRVDQSRIIEQNLRKTRLNWRVFLKNEEDLRPEERRLLAKYAHEFPILNCFYHVKEDLRSMYCLVSREEASEKFKSIRLRMEAADIIELKLWARSLRRHEKYILNFFDHRTTNAYTEGIHVQCKLTQRISFGFRNIDVYIRKAMLAFLPLAALTNYHRF